MWPIINQYKTQMPTRNLLYLYFALRETKGSLINTCRQKINANLILKKVMANHIAAIQLAKEMGLFS